MRFQGWHANVNQDDVRVPLRHHESISARLNGLYPGKPGEHAFGGRVGAFLLYRDNF
jgi:hypothetical protein